MGRDQRASKRGVFQMLISMHKNRNPIPLQCPSETPPLLRWRGGGEQVVSNSLPIIGILCHKDEEQPNLFRRNRRKGPKEEISPPLLSPPLLQLLLLLLRKE